MRQKIFTLLYTVIFVFCGLVYSQSVRAAIVNDDLKTFMKAFLLQTGGTDNKANWERLNGISNPESGDAWWGELESGGYIYSWGGPINIYLDAVAFYGDLDLNDISGLNSINFCTDNLGDITISQCEDLEYISLSMSNDEASSDGIGKNISVSGCPKLNSFDYSSINPIDDLVITQCDVIGSISIYNQSTINTVAIDGGDSFYSFSITNNGSNINNITIGNTTSSFNLATNGVDAACFPVFSFPNTITELTLARDGTTDLRVLPSLETLSLSEPTSDGSFSAFPILPQSIKEIYCSRANVSGEIDLSGLENLTILECENNNITDISNMQGTLLTKLHCGNNNIETLSGFPSSLTELSCYSNKIEILSLQNTSIKTLRCEDNSINELSNLPLTLQYIYCRNNKLSGELDLSQLNDLYELDCRDNKLTNIKFEESKGLGDISISAQFNYLSFNTISDLIDGDFNWSSNYLPQNYTDYGTKSVGESIDLSVLAGAEGKCYWYDITDKMPEFKKDLGDYFYFIQANLGTEITDVSDILSGSGNIFELPGSLKGRVLLCGVFEEKPDFVEGYNNVPGIYYLVNVGGETVPVQIQIEIDGSGNWKNVDNNTATTISTYVYNENSGKWEISNDKSVALKMSFESDIEYDTWNMKYSIVDNTSSNDITYEEETGLTGNSYTFNEMVGISDGSLSVVISEITLYDSSQSLLAVYSFAYDPYQHTITISDIPVLFFEEAINDINDFALIENDIITTVDKGNKVHLRMGLVGSFFEQNPEDFNSFADYQWQIEYTTSDATNATPIWSEPTDIGDYYYFNNGLPHQQVGEYPYSVTKLYIYKEGTPPAEAAALRSAVSPTAEGTYEYTANPYNHTIIIKDNGGTDPDPDPEVNMQFAVAINNMSYSNVPNHHTTAVEKGTSVYLNMSAVTENVDYSSWQIDYTTPAGENVTSTWTNRNSPFVFNAGNPHIEKGTYKYIVNRLRLNDAGSIYTFSFTQSPYTNTIMITESDEPGPGPDPDPVPGIEIPVTASPLKSCPTEEFVLLPYELKYNKYSLFYTIHFSEEAKAAGFDDQLERKLLPEGYITISLPAGVTPGTYKGTIKLTSEDTKQPINDCSFEIKVLTGTQITLQPVSIHNLCIGDMISLSTEAIGENLAYQWYYNDMPITGAINPTYEVPFEESLTGQYYVEVSGFCGVKESDVVEVTGSRLYIHMKWDDFMYVLNTDNQYVSFQWYKDGAPIDKYGTSVYYTNADGLKGTYFVRATKADGTVDESCPKIFDVHTKAFSVNIYPNPVVRNENLTIIINSVNEADGKSRVDIVDMSGRKVYSNTINGNRIDIPMNVTAGSYIAKIITPEGRVTTQVVMVK